MEVTKWTIDNEADADEYLHALLAEDKYRSMNEVTIRAQQHIPDETIRAYFLKKAQESLG